MISAPRSPHFGWFTRFSQSRLGLSIGSTSFGQSFLYLANFVQSYTPESVAASVEPDGAGGSSLKSHAPSASPRPVATAKRRFGRANMIATYHPRARFARAVGSVMFRTMLSVGRRFAHALVVFVAFALVALVPSTGRAQLHSDVSLQAGIEKRLLASRGPAVPDAGVGPRLDLRAHFAFFPFIRLGGYGAFAFAPQAGEGRTMGSLGVHAKIVSPFPRTDSFSLWLGFGAGYARTFVSGPSSPAGGYVEVPVGIGAGYKVRKPFTIFGEVQSIFGVGHHGSAYAGGGGNDGVMLAFSLGLLVDL